MSIPCTGENYVQTIDRTECIGNSLVKINSNFKNLDLAACELEQRVADLGEIQNLSVRDSSTINLTYNTTTRVLSAEVVGKVQTQNGGAGYTTGILKALEGVVSAAVPDADYVSLNITNAIRNNVSFLSGQIVSLSANAFASLSSEILARLGQDFAFSTDLASLSAQVYTLAATEIHDRTAADELIFRELQNSIEAETQERKDTLRDETLERRREDSTERSERTLADNQLSLTISQLRYFVTDSDAKMSTKVDNVSSSATSQFASVNYRIDSLSSTTNREITNESSRLSSAVDRDLDNLNLNLSNRITSLSSTTNREISSLNTRITNLSAHDVRALSITGGVVGGTTVFSVSSQTPALRVTQSGTGNAIVVEDSTNPDLTPFVVNQYGQTIIGKPSTRMLFDTTTGVVPSLQIEGDDQGKSSMLLCGDTANTIGGGAVHLGRTRSSTLSGSEIVRDGDLLGLVSFNGADGNKLVQGAHVAAYVSGSPSNNDMPTRLVFSTSPEGNATPVERAIIYPDGRTQFNGTFGIKSADPVLPALTILNEGSGDCLVIKDAFNDLTPFVINKDGQVGIGNNNPQTTLDVNGGVKANLIDCEASLVHKELTVGEGIRTQCTTLDNSALVAINPAGSTKPCVDIANLGHGHSLQTKNFVINNNGFVGIGNYNSNPQFPLHVVGETMLDGHTKIQGDPLDFTFGRTLLEVQGGLSAVAVTSKTCQAGEYKVLDREGNRTLPTPIIVGGQDSPYMFYGDAPLGSLYLRSNDQDGDNLYLKRTSGWAGINNDGDTNKIDKPSNPTPYSSLIYNPATVTWVASSEPPKILKPSTASAYQVLTYNSSTATWVASGTQNYSYLITQTNNLASQTNSLASQIDDLLLQIENLSLRDTKRPIVFNTNGFNGSPATPKTITKRVILEPGTYDATLKYYVDVTDYDIGNNSNRETNIEFTVKVQNNGVILASNTANLNFYRNGGAGYARRYDNIAIGYDTFTLNSNTTVEVEIKLVNLFGSGKHTEFTINPVKFS